MQLQIAVRDSTGREWYNKLYTEIISRFPDYKSVYIKKLLDEMYASKYLKLNVLRQLNSPVRSLIERDIHLP